MELEKKLAILEGYLPKQMSAEEVEAKVKELLAQAGIEVTAEKQRFNYEDSDG